jgi:hypothetical protein
VDAQTAAQAKQMLGEHPVALTVLQRVVSIVDVLGTADVRVSKSQISLSRRHGFAYLWRPRQYLDKGAEIVLSIALGRRDHSPRFKEVAHSSPKHWLHHLEINDPDAVDTEVASWLREAFDRAG